MNKKQEEKLRRLSLADRRRSLSLSFDYLLWKEGTPLTSTARKLLEEKIAEHKREYRRILRNSYGSRYEFPGKDGKGRGEIVNGWGSWDSWCRKVVFPGEHWTDEEKQEFIEAVWVPYIPSYYDCTGQLSTWAVEVFNTPSGVVAFVHDHLDV